jgi:selenocysteine lyase/cysteine desulfurase
VSTVALERAAPDVRAERGLADQTLLAPAGNPSPCASATRDFSPSPSRQHDLDPSPSLPRNPSPGTRPLLPVVGAGLLVPVVPDGFVPYTNLDYAASAPCLDEVATHIAELLPYYASIHRGAGYCSQVSTAVYEQARARVGAFVGARTDDVTVFTRNTTDALNLLAGCVPTHGPGDGSVLVLDIEHHANLLPWRRGRHRCVLAGTTQRATLISLRAELAARPATLVAVTGASNVTGEVLPLEEIVSIAHAAGARVVVDAAQLAPHRQIDLTSSGVDYVAFSGHKLYAPFGSGALVGRRDWLDAAPAYLPGGGAVRDVHLDSVTWAEAPQRHEGGTPAVVGAAALARACEAIAGLQDGALETHEQVVRERLVARLAAVPGVRVHRLWRDSPASIGVVAFSVTGFEPGYVAACLSAEYGIGVRDGKFCAHPLLSRLGVRDGAVRASIGAGTVLDDVDRLADAVEELVASGARWQYEVVDGRWSPVPDPRPVPAWVDGHAFAPSAATSPCERGSVT